MASAWKPAKACHDFNNDFTLFTAVPVLFNKVSRFQKQSVQNIYHINLQTLSIPNIWVL